MKIAVEKQPNCIVGIRVEIEAERVRKERTNIVNAFSRVIKVPGYRPGKVPAHIVEQRFKKEIQDELRERLVNAGLREALTTQKLKPLSVLDVQDAALGFDDFFNFKATLAVEPDFELPDYSTIPIEVPAAEVSATDIDEMIEIFRGRQARFEEIAGRGVEMEDYVQIDYEGTQEGKPLVEVIEELPANFAGAQNQWLRVAPGVLLPGFCEQLVGANAGEERAFDLEVPVEFAEKKLAGERVHYRVHIKTIRQRVLPDVNDDFAKSMGEESLEALREKVAGKLLLMRQQDIERLKRDRIIEYLATKVDCELPANLVFSETRRIVDRIVRVNSERGISEEKIKESEKEIVGGAAKSAQLRVRSAFILQKIAEKEGITLTPQEFEARLAEVAQSAQTTPAKLKKELEKNGALDRLEQEFVQDKVIDFLLTRASVTEVKAAPA